ncbi:MAG: hypothetical protein K9N29_04730 [Candidatus Marinimicrobia bacterium]|nr:hypothetical protein [Candidatus Neomarinimicrobiota bacterium]
MNLRIQSILDHARVQKGDTELWILLYPPEIHTTTMYLPSHASSSEVRALIREQIFLHLPYPFNYDWENYAITMHENGNSENMVTVTILGKHVLPRIRELLDDYFSRVKFIGDGLQFLNIDNTYFQQLRGQTYEMILPYDEMYFVAAFRSGFHVESSVLTHGCSPSFGDYKLNHQQVYLDIRQQKNLIYQPKIQPVVAREDWRKAGLTQAAFPTWFIAANSLHQRELVNFVKQTNVIKDKSKSERPVHKYKAIHLLD